MRAWLTCVMMVFASAGVQAKKPLQMPVWPNGAPDSNELSGAERGRACIGNISEASMSVYLPEKAKATGAAMVIAPGGGYEVVCSGSEGVPAAKLLVARGIVAVLVKYRIPNGHHEIPANDIRRVIRTVRANAKEWGVDVNRVGVMSFSAGGHLASTVATVFDSGVGQSVDPIERHSSRPDAAVLIYPVISMADGVTHKGSRKNLTGGDESLFERYSSEAQVTPATPPTFLLHCTDDKLVPVENALRFYRALVENDVPATAMIYEKGGHGPPAYNKNPSWLPAFEAWLKARKMVK